MKPPITGITASQGARQTPLSSPKPYPVSIRAYRKKDFEYLSAFPHSPLRTTIPNAEFSRARSDAESVASLMTTSSSDFGTSTTCTSSASSIGSYRKNVMEVESSRYLLSTETSTDSARVSMDLPKPHAEAADDEKHEKPSPAQVKVDQKVGDTDEVPMPPEDSAAQVKEKRQTKARLRHADAQLTALPRFGSWDTRNPTSGEAYTAIFRRLRDEKKSGGLPVVCPSPTHENAEGPIDGQMNLFSPERTAKEPLHSNPTVRKPSSSSSKSKGGKKGSQEKSAHVKKPPSVWSLCCKASVVDD